MASSLIDKYGKKQLSSSSTALLQKYKPITTQYQPTTSVEDEEKNKGGLLGGIGYTLGKLGTGAFGILEGIWDYTAGGIADLFGADEWAEEQFANNVTAGWNQDLDEWYNPGKGMQIVGDVASGVGNTLVGIGTAAALTFFSGGALAPYAGAVAAGTMGLGAAGGATSEAYAKTGELGLKEYGYGALAGGTEAALEKLTGVGSKYAAKLLGKETAKTVAKKTVLSGLLSDFKGEFVEEAISEFITPYYQRWTQVDQNAENATIQQVFYAGMVGGLSGALMGGIGTGISTVQAMNRGNEISKNQEYANNVVKTAEKFANYEAENGTGNEAHQYISGLVADFKARDKGTGELTATQKKLLGEMERANVVLTYEPAIQRSKEKIIADADNFAEYINSRNITDGTTGKPFHFANGAELTQNEGLVTQFAVADALGELLLTPDSVYSIVSDKRTDGIMQDDFRNFQKNASAENKKAVGELFGIDVDGMTYEDFIETIKKTDKAKFDSIQGGMAARAASKKAISSAKNTGTEINAFDKGANIVEGTTVFTSKKGVGGKIIAITKAGNGYYLYNGKDISKKLTKAQLLEAIDVLNGVAPATNQATETTAKKGQKTAKKPTAQTSPTETQTAQESQIAQSKKKTVNTFAEQLDAWDKVSTNKSFIVGKTSEALKQVGVAEKEVRFDSSKIKKILDKHSEMSIENIKQVPEIIKNPILILKSKSVEGRLVLFGEAYDQNNNPILVALELNPTSKKGKAINIVKIASAYGKSKVQNLLNSSDILYVDKNEKRVNTWLKVNRLQLPLLNQNTNSTNSIPENSKNVNTFDKKSQEKEKNGKTTTKKTTPKAKATETTTAKPVKGKTLHGKTYKDFTVEEFNALSAPFRAYYLAKSKKPNAIVFAQLGDFYEAFFDDAKTAANELELTLTGRAVNGYSDRVEMVGFPVAKFDDYKAKLNAKGLDVVKVDLDGKKVLYSAKTGTESTTQYAISESATQEAQLAGGKSQNLTPLQMKRAESFARTHVKGYENLTAAEKLEVEWTIASGWRYGASESDILSLAKISAQSGVGIGFADVKATTSDGKTADADAACYSRSGHLTIYLNPKSKRTVEVATLHELTHALEGTEGYAELRKKAEDYYAKHPEEKAAIDKMYRELYKNEQVRYADEILPSELTAHYIEKMLEKRNVLAQMTAEQPTFMQRCINWLKTRVDKLRGVDTQAADEVDMLARKFVSTFNLNKGKVVNKGSTIRNYSLSRSFAEQVDDVLTGKHDPNYDLFVSETPQVLRDIGFESKPLLMRNSKVKEILTKHPEMSSDLIKKIPQAVADPVMIIKSKTNPTESVVVITDVQTSKGEMIIPVWINQDGTYLEVELGNSIRLNTNFVASAYGRSIKALVEYAIDNNEVLFYAKDKKRVSTLLATHGLQSPARLSTANFINSISEKSKNVNSFSQKTEKKFALSSTVESDIKKYYGSTYNWRETGYILKDGTRLDLSGRKEGARGGYRTVDHRDIFDVVENGDIYGSDAMIEFIGRGNIRVMPENAGINLQVEPNNEQYRLIQDFVERVGWRDGYFSVDIDNQNGQTIETFTYEGKVR